MAKVILGGQLLSLLLSLLVTPVAYSIWDDMMNRGKRVAAWIDRRRARPAPAAMAMAEPAVEHTAAETVQEVPVFREAESDAAPTGS